MPIKRKNPFAVELSKLRMTKMTPEQRSEVARKAGTQARANQTPKQRSAQARKAGLAGGGGRGKKER